MVDTRDLAALKETETWVFDLDNTLYPASTNLFAQVDERMRDFIANFLDLELDEAYQLQKKYFKECGTTLRGLMSHHDMEPGSYLDYVHDIDISGVQPSQGLRNSLNGLSGQKYIFTNASRSHAERVMERLGVSDCFVDIFDIVDAGYEPKPASHVYDQFVEKFQINPKKSVMVEDMIRNLEPAAKLGMGCVWVQTNVSWAQEGIGAAYIDYETKDLEAWLAQIVGV